MIAEVLHVGPRELETFSVEELLAAVAHINRINERAKEARER